MSRTRARYALWSLLAAVPVALLASSCQDPTQLTLVISAEPQCAITATAVYVGADPDAAHAKSQTGSPEALTSHCVAGDVGTLVVTPGQTSGAVVVVAGVGKQPTDCFDNHYDGCIVARRSFGFVKHTPLRMPIELDIDCENVPCDATTTCVHGHCKSSAVECTKDGTCSDPGASGDVLVDGGPKFGPDGAPITMTDSGMSGMDGASGGDASSSVDGSDGASEVDGSSLLDGGTTSVDGGPTFDSGNPAAMCKDDGTGTSTLFFAGCGGKDCSSLEACCEPTGLLSPVCDNAVAGQCAGSPGIGCCMTSQCPGGMICCTQPLVAAQMGAIEGGTQDASTAPTCLAPPTAGGSPGSCR